MAESGDEAGYGVAECGEEVRDACFAVFHGGSENNRHGGESGADAFHFVGGDGA